MRRILAIVLMVALASCGGDWYHPIKSDADFEKDHAECKALAEQTAVAESMTGRRLDLEIYYSTLHHCLYRKGWSNAPPGDKKLEQQPPKPLARRLGETAFEFGGQKLELPEGSKVVKQTRSAYGPMTMESFDFLVQKGETTYHGQVVFQRATSVGFDPVDYPVDEPFFTYTKGKMANGIRWRAFAGEVEEKAWVGVVGGYWLVSDVERIIIAVSRELSPQHTPPPARCRLNTLQGRQLEKMVSFAKPWLSGLGEKEMGKILPIRWEDYHFVVDFSGEEEK